ncbi:MAG: hypothetical protein GXY44_10280 [Phycisphaerales bacterium]|nr:hypothetical protein [Phycisphaerales bacterium]
MTTTILDLPPLDMNEDEPSFVVCPNPIQVVDGQVSDPTQLQQMRLIESAGCLDFWNDPCEDIYSPGDGGPL